MAIIGAAIGALVLIIIVVIIIVVCKRRNSLPNMAAQTHGGREAHTNEAYYMQPVKSDEDINEYDDIPADHAPGPPKNENQYMDLGGSQKEPNVYDRVQT